MRSRERDTPVDGLDDIVEEFLVESHENLDQLDSDLVALEQEPNSRERLSSIFRPWCIQALKDSDARSSGGL